MNESAILNFDPFEGDFGEPGDTVLSNKMVTARKAGPCSHCAHGIQPGERVRSMTAKFGDFMSYRWCAGCCAVMAEIELNDCPNDGEDDGPDWQSAWEHRSSTRTLAADQQTQGGEHV